MKALLFAITLVSAANAVEPAVLTAEQQVRYDALIEELRCLVCQNQNLKESHAPLAEDLRREVREQISANKDDAAIKDYLVARYGDFVLYRPRFQPTTWVLWLAPAGLLFIALFVVLRLLRSKPEPTGTPDAASVDRILREQERRK